MLSIANYTDTSAVWSDRATAADIGYPLPRWGRGTELY